MSFSKFGSIIKNRREEMGYTQEELADGICSVPTLSRIENGDRMPSKEHFEMLIQRLGYSDTTLDAYVDEQEFKKHELKFQIRQAVILKKMTKADALLKQYEQLLKPPTPIDKQFLILHQILIHPEEHTPTEQRISLENALKLTCPRYEENHFPMLLSYEEIILTNNIAIAYYHEAEYEKAITLLCSLKRFYENHVVNPEEALRTEPMILYNLSKYLGLTGRYDESIETSSLGIRVCSESGRCTALAMLFYNNSWALIKRGHVEDFTTAKMNAKKAVYLATILGQTNYARHCRKFYCDSFGEEISL